MLDICPNVVSVLINRPCCPSDAQFEVTDPTVGIAAATDIPCKGFIFIGYLIFDLQFFKFRVNVFSSSNATVGMATQNNTKPKFPER